MAVSEALKPCPFCGDMNIIADYDAADNPHFYCTRCECDLLGSVQEWNTRAPDPETAAVIAAARKMAAHYTAVFDSMLPHALEYLGAGHYLTKSLAEALAKLDEGKAE